MDESIFSYLINYVPTEKRDAKEDYLTQMFAWLLKNVGGYADDYLRFLQSVAPSIQVANFDELDDCEVITQQIVSEGRIDLLLKFGTSFQLICEHKVYSELSEDQIAKYMRCAENGELGEGTAYSVLVTAYRSQHTQEADARITWGDICSFTEGILSQYDGIDQFMLEQFVLYLKEKGLSHMTKIDLVTVEHYSSAVTLEDKLQGIFSSLEKEDWSVLCPGLLSFPECSSFDPRFQNLRWGRTGIEFFRDWKPGLFAGVLLRTEDHKLPPMDINKGPDFVVFLESLYGGPKTTNGDTYQKITNSPRYRAMVARLSNNSGSFDFLPGLKESKWRIAVLRKPLYDVLEGASTMEDQKNAIRDAIAEGINLLVGKE